MQTKSANPALRRITQIMLRGGPRAERVAGQLRDFTARQNALPVSTFWRSSSLTTQQRLYSAGMDRLEQLRQRAYQPGLIQAFKDWFRPAQRADSLTRFSSLNKSLNPRGDSSSWQRLFKLGLQQMEAQPLPFTHYHDKIIPGSSSLASLFKLFRPGFGTRSFPKLMDGVTTPASGGLEMFKVNAGGTPLRFSTHVADAAKTMTAGRVPGDVTSASAWRALDPKNWRAYPFYETVLRGKDIAGTLTHARSFTPASVGDDLRALLQKIQTAPQIKSLNHFGLTDKWRAAARAYETAPTVSARELPVVPSKVVWKGQGGDGFKSDSVVQKPNHYWFSGHPTISSGYAFKSLPDTFKVWEPGTAPQVAPGADILKALQTKITAHPVYGRLLNNPAMPPTL